MSNIVFVPRPCMGLVLVIEDALSVYPDNYFLKRSPK